MPLQAAPNLPAMMEATSAQKASEVTTAAWLPPLLALTPAHEHEQVMWGTGLLLQYTAKVRSLLAGDALSASELASGSEPAAASSKMHVATHYCWHLLAAGCTV